MFDKVRNFLSRHRNKFIFGGVFIGGTILLSNYAKKYLRDWQERETKELLERARKQQHYDSVERTCNETALTMTPNLKNLICKHLKTDDLVQQLKLGTSDKLKLWDELKVLAFSKLTVLVYSSSLLIVILRIQLNVIGGYMFCDRELDKSRITSNIQEKYLGMCQFFMEEGVLRLSKLIQEKVKIALQDMSLKGKLSIQDIELIFWVIQSSVGMDKRDPCKSLSTYILPDSCKKDTNFSKAQILDKIIIETNDLLESEEIIHITESCISRGFSFVVDQISDFFKEKAYAEPPKGNNSYSNSNPTTSYTPDVLVPAKSTENFVNLNNIKIPLAKVIPIVNGLVQSHLSKDDVPHCLIQQLIFMDSLKVMGANIYETFSSKE